MWNIIEIDGIEVHVLKNSYNNKMSFFRRMISFMGFALASSLHILKIKADVVLATSTPLSIAIPALVKNILQKTPYIFEARDIWPEAPIALGVLKNKLAIKLALWFEHYIYKRSAAIVVLSTDMKKSIETRHKNIPPVTVIPNLSELNRFDLARNGNHTGNSPEKIVLYAGNVAIVNNIEFMVKLAEALLKIDATVKFHIYTRGTGNRYDKVKEMASEKGLLGVNFFLHGAVPKNKLPEIYKTCTVASSFVANIPELWGNSANKFFDTLAAGKPILINHGGWQAEEIRNYNIGYLLDPDESKIEETALEFAKYISNKSLIAEQGRNAYLLAKEKYALPVAVENYSKVLETVEKEFIG
jgi:glycosyltransferase involved in cell wall biosynthesis